MTQSRRFDEGGRGAPRRAVLALVAGLALQPAVGTAARAQADPNPGYATQPFTPKSFTMPGGTGCAGDVARWRAVQANDYGSGNIGLKVFDQIQGEIARADAACQAGREGQARAMVHASKRRHGYPD